MDFLLSLILNLGVAVVEGVAHLAKHPPQAANVSPVTTVGESPDLRGEVETK